MSNDGEQPKNAGLPLQKLWDELQRWCTDNLGHFIWDNLGHFIWDQQPYNNHKATIVTRALFSHNLPSDRARELFKFNATIKAEPPTVSI